MILSISFHYEDNSINTIQKDTSVLSINFNVSNLYKVFSLKNLQLDNGTLLDKIIKEVEILKIRYRMGDIIDKEIDLRGMCVRSNYTLDTQNNSEVFTAIVESINEEVNL